MKFVSNATRWGCDHEQTAYDAYRRQVSGKHINFKLSKSGLVVNTQFPFMGASPDGVLGCSCCDNGVLEIKCPFSCRDKAFLEKAKDGAFFLHAYYE